MLKLNVDLCEKKGFEELQIQQVFCSAQSGLFCLRLTQIDWLQREKFRKYLREKFSTQNKVYFNIKGIF